MCHNPLLFFYSMEGKGIYPRRLFWADFDLSGLEIATWEQLGAKDNLLFNKCGWSHGWKHYIFKLPIKHKLLLNGKFVSEPDGNIFNGKKFKKGWN